MAYKVKKPCRVCGKMYTPCSDCERDKTAFHWRTVACSEECGREYLRRVLEARSPKAEKDIIDPENIKEDVQVKNEKRGSSKKAKSVKIEETVEKLEAVDNTEEVSD